MKTFVPTTIENIWPQGPRAPIPISGGARQIVEAAPTIEFDRMLRSKTI